MKNVGIMLGSYSRDDERNDHSEIKLNQSLRVYYASTKFQLGRRGGRSLDHCSIQIVEKIAK